MTIWRPINKAIELTNSIYTIGHSTRSVAELVELLRQAGVDLLVDVRSAPRSRTNPQFNTDALPGALAGTGIEYRHIRALGGLRHKPKDAPPSAAPPRIAATGFPVFARSFSASLPPSLAASTTILPICLAF